MWLSGKYAVERKNKDEIVEKATKEAANALRQLIPEDSKAVYSDLQVKRGQETGRWLKSLSGQEDQSKATEEWQKAQNKAADAFEETRRWMDALFNEFGGLTYTFNQNAVGTDLFVSVERPQVIEKRDESLWYRPVTRDYQGRLATRYWSLVVRGDEKRIGVFLFPAEMTIGFKAGHYTEEELPPFLVAEAATVNGRSTWKIQGEEASGALAAPLAKEIFGDLIRVASGKMSEAELFTSHKEDAPKLGENVAVGYDAGASRAQAAQTADLKVNVEGMTVFEACDVVDKVIDKELKGLYEQATKAPPGSPDSTRIRKQISAVEAFRMKVVDAFENFSQESHSITEAEAVGAGKS